MSRDLVTFFELFKDYAKHGVTFKRYNESLNSAPETAQVNGLTPATILQNTILPRKDVETRNDDANAGHHQGQDAGEIFSIVKHPFQNTIFVFRDR
ncbi:hypothetical protein V6N13_074854 [Hibiscus sabdariffa]|uniref:Uncharacterized protein n=1 Tax=Hibiscus sabdariffa TaxID=183260 RepID=A0ABR2U9Q2_9ROSI